jgi:hypothetical protein
MKTYHIVSGEKILQQEAIRHKIDEHNNLHLMGSYNDILVIQANWWSWFKVEEKEPVG